MKDPHYLREHRKYEYPIASREAILTCMQRQGEPVSFKRLAKLLEVDNSRDREAFKLRLRAMVRDGQLIADRRNVYAIANRMELFTGLISAHSDGFGFVVCDESREDIFLSHKQMRAVFHGDGVIVALKDDIWSRSPEKVLGLREDWANSNPELVSSLVRALVCAAEWADQPGNRVELAHILSEEANVGAPFEVLNASLSGKPVLRPGEPPLDLPDRHVFYRYTATFPWLSQGRWLGEQMKRWRQIPEDSDLKTVIREVYRPDLYRTAVDGLDVLVPQDDWRVEGAANSADQALVGRDQFLDDSVFEVEC